MLARAASLELKVKAAGIRINSVSHGGVATQLWKTMPFRDDLVAQHGSEQGAWAARHRGALIVMDAGYSP